MIEILALIQYVSLYTVYIYIHTIYTLSSKTLGVDWDDNPIHICPSQKPFWLHDVHVLLLLREPAGGDS
jgi:hypothetical protein